MGTPAQLLNTLRRTDVHGVTVEKPDRDGQPWTAGVKLNGKWRWYYAATATEAVDRVLQLLNATGPNGKKEDARDDAEP